MKGQGSSGTARLFFALLPDPETTQQISWHANQFSPGIGTRVKAGNFHITLLFLGNVDTAKSDALCLDCDGLHLPGFNMVIDSVGWWQKAKILWLAPKSIPQPLSDLAASLAGFAARKRIVTEGRTYFPHITLMRKVAQAPQYPVVKPFTWRADGFSLMQSFTRPEGVQYTELAHWPLVH